MTLPSFEEPPATDAPALGTALATAMDGEAPIAAPVGAATKRGFVWLMGQTVGSKLLSVVQQIVLARLLLPEDWGVVGLAYTVVGLAGVIQQTGLREILIQRQKHFERWANVGFWMALAQGVAAAAIMAAAAPFAARAYASPSVAGLILVLAAATPLNALVVTPNALLSIQLRFRAQAVIAFASNVLLAGLTILLAAMKFGVYSFVLPKLVLAAVQIPVYWRLAPTPVRWSPQLKRWRFVLVESAYVLGAYICYWVYTQGDNVSLGLFHKEDKRQIGIYWFAFNLSLQTITLFTVNLWGVLTPALSKLQDEPKRQLEGFLKATKLLAIVGVPFTLLQAAAAGPAVRLFFKENWDDAIPVVQVLSLGMMFAMVGAPGASLLQARGKFNVLFYLALGCAGVFALLMLAANLVGAAHVGPANAVGIAVALFFAVYGPVNLYVGIRTINGTWRNVVSAYAPALMAGVPAMAAAYFLPRLFPALARSDILSLSAICAAGIALYIVLLCFVDPDAVRLVKNRLLAFRR